MFLAALLLSSAQDQCADDFQLFKIQFNKTYESSEIEQKAM